MIDWQEREDELIEAELYETGPESWQAEWGPFKPGNAFVEVIISTKPGFAMMDPSKQREIARAGGNAASLSEFGNRFREGEAAAKAAGVKGGRACAAKKVGAHASKEKSP